MSFLNIIGKEAELLEAARTGNLQTVEKLLSSKSKKSQHVGGAIGQKLSSFLKSVNVNHTDKNGYTALHHAAVNGHRDVVEALLKAEAQPGLVDNQGCTPVHLAAWNGDAEIVMQLLMAGMDSEVVSPVHVNQQNGTGDTALHCAAQYGHVAVVDVLLQKLANPTIRNLNEASPLDLAAQYGRLEVVQLLLISHPELARHPSSTQSPLHLASRNGHRDIAAVLLDHHFDIQTMTETGSALHEAALHGKLDVVKFLLERGIDVNQRDEKGQTVLELLSAHQAQQKSFTEITRAIQEHMRESGDPNADPGLYDRLASCHSGVNKPTAAVKPLPPEKPHPSDKPLPPDKPHPSDTEKPEEMTSDRPVSVPRNIEYQSSPISEPETSPLVPMYSKPNKEKTDLDRVISTASSAFDEGPPPLPPRTSVFTLEDRYSIQPPEQSVPSIPESSPPGGKSSMQKPKKPPRQKRSPAPQRKSPIESLEVETSTSTTEKTNANIPEQFINIPSAQSVHNDSANCENSSQHSLPCADQLHCEVPESDQPDTSILSHSTQSSPPVKSPSPSLSQRKRENFSEPQSGRSVSQGFYVEMSSVNKPDRTKRPVSEVKPQMKDCNNTLNLQPQPPAQQGVDNYDILFPNLKKLSADISSKPELRRMNTAPNPEDDVYVKPFPTSPTEKFKEKQGLLRRTHTAPDESTYLPMNNVKQEDWQEDSTQKENEYAEIPEKEGSLSPGSPKENVYATITETDESKHVTNFEVESNEYSQIKDLSPAPSPRHSRETKGDGDSEKMKVESSKSGERKTDNDMKGEIKEDIGKSEDDSKENQDNKEEKTNTEKDREMDVNKGSPKPTHLDFLKSKPGTPLTPTGYPQPPTPDFPPPSPATAMLGIEMKIQQIDSKRKSRDITTITDDTLGCIQEQRSEVKATEDNSEVKLNEKSPEVKVTAEVKDSGIKESETKQSDLVKENQTGADSEDLLSDSNTKTDQSEDSSSVIASQIKSIPKSSIPNTVIETEADRMSKNRPPIAKKPDIKSRSFKAKEPEEVTKRSVTEKSDSVSVKVTDQRDSENSAPIAGDTTAKITDKLKNADISNGDSDKSRVTDQKVSESSTVEGNDSVNEQVRDQKQTSNNSTAEGGGSPVVLRRKTSTPDMDVFKG